MLDQASSFFFFFFLGVQVERTKMVEVAYLGGAYVASKDLLHSGVVSRQCLGSILLSSVGCPKHGLDVSKTPRLPPNIANTIP